MTSRSTVRKPPRRRSARRIAAAFLITLILVFASPGGVGAYPCSYADGGQIASSDCVQPRPKTKKRVPGEPNVVSLAIFLAVLLGVVAIPITYFRPAAADPE